MVEEKLKRRLVGASVLVSLIVIFVPMLLEGEPVVEVGIFKSNVPAQPEEDFSSRVLPLADTVVTPIASSETSGTNAAEVDSSEEPSTQPTNPRVGLSAWVIQVGSFSNQKNAEGLVAKLKKANFPAFLEQTDVQGKTLFRVRVGPEIDQKLAEKLLIRLNKALKPMKLKGSLKKYR